MDTNIGLPSEILFLCTTTKTKEKAFSLFEQIRRNIHVPPEIAKDPALPAVCSLIASEQLGNTVLSERRAQQWSRSTPEHFRTLKAETKKLLFSLNIKNNSNYQRLEDGLIKYLAHEFELETIFSEYIIAVEKALKADIPEKWRIQTQTVQISIFMWICRRFKLHTKLPIESLIKRYDILFSDLEDIQIMLNKRWPSNADITKLLTGRDDLPSTNIPNPNNQLYRDSNVSTKEPIDFSRLIDEFELESDIVDGLIHLQKVILQTETLKNLVDWDTTLGKCTIFYWTCSVLKITGIKHLTLRTHYNVAKKDFDKLILALDSHRGDLRKSLEDFYDRNGHLTHPFKSTQLDSFDRVSDEILSDNNDLISPTTSTRSGKRRRSRKKNNSPMSTSVPISDYEVKMSKISRDNRTYNRALLLFRSWMVNPLPSLEHIPSEAFPLLIVFLANEQLQNNQLTEKEIVQMSALRMDEFVSALTALRSLTKNWETMGGLIAQTKFDDMALEHGLCINTVVAMIDAWKHLKESKCLSEHMNWESPLVICAILFWSCAILQVPDTNMNTLRKDSQASKREFDSMLQLLNNHCSHIRHRMELDQKKGYLVLTRNIPTHKSTNALTPHSLTTNRFSQESGAEPERPNKILKSEKLALSSSKHTNSTHVFQSFDDTIAQIYPNPVATASTTITTTITTTTRVNMDIVPGSNKATISDVGTSVSGRSHYRPPAEGGTSISRSSKTHQSYGSGNIIDTSCAATSTLGEGGIASNARYSTQDYADIKNRIEVWVPHGKLSSQNQYHLWEEKMVEKYGSAWEQNITRDLSKIYTLGK
ncbi:hypothetical protein Clacol_007712 [Clathrus columnatus]|uniref:Uncharacterized protein n=1 Tax=Clathrus columnatus TaxID=1419009 RepID=A0AAV5AIX2_9AGAM|nr:hypothetical protein Clacol_007712 [Clathrus columnatus]